MHVNIVGTCEDGDRRIQVFLVFCFVASDPCNEGLDLSVSFRVVWDRI